MLSKIGSVSRRAFSEKESQIAGETINDGDDLFITESFQPGEENSSVLGNSSYVGHVEAPAMPFEDDKNIYAEPSDSTVTSTSMSTSTDSIGTQPNIPAGRLSLPQRLTRTIPKRDQLSKLTEDMPWALYGNDQVSRLANDALDAGDDIHVSASCDQDDYSVVGNTSVAPFDAQSTTGETDEDNHIPTIATQASKAKKGLFRKLSLTKSKITRILPSKQYVSKLSRLAEDVPWSMNSQEQISRQAGETLNEGDDLFISESFEPLEADTSSVLGNTSYVSATKSTLGSGASADEKRDDISVYEPFLNEPSRVMNEPKIVRTGTRNTSVTEKLKNAIPAPVTDTLKSAIPVAEKLKNAIPTPVTQKLKSVPSSVVSSSQKLMPWRLKSMANSEYRTPLVSEYQEVSDDTSDGARDLNLPSKYHTRTPESGKKRDPQKGSMQLSSRDKRGQEIAFSLSTDSSRSRSLTWDNASCSDMSEITEPSVYSRSRSFRKTHSMYIVHPGESLLGSADEDSEVGADGNGSTTSSSNTRGSRLIELTGDRSMTNLPNINESKPFSTMSSTEIFSPSVVNGFLNRMESNDKPINDKPDKSWDAVSILSNEDWQRTPVSDIHDTANRQRVFSDSDAVFEFQRQRSARDIDEAPTEHMPGALKELKDDDSLTLFLDNADSTDESEANAPPAIETDQQTQSFQTQAVFHDSEFSAHLLHSREESDFWTTTKGSTDNSIDDGADVPWSQGPHFPSNPKTINDDTAKADIDFDSVDAAWNQRRRFASDSFALSNPAEKTIDVDDDSIWSARPRFASDSEVVIATDAHAIDAIWSQEPHFATDAFAIDDTTPEHTANFDDDYSQSHEPLSSNPDGISDSTTADVLSEHIVDVDAAEHSWEVSSDSEAANDDVAGQNGDADSTEALWSQRPVYGNDSDVVDDSTAANSSSENVIAVIAVEETDPETDSSSGQEPTFKVDGMVDSNDVTDQTIDLDPDSTWTQRPRYSSDPVVFNNDATAHTSTENTIDIDAAPDASWNPRPHFLSDPVVIMARTTDNTIEANAGATGNSSSSLGRRFSSNSVKSNNDVAETTIDVDRDSSWDERPRFLSASVAINDNTANSEIEISLHGEENATNRTSSEITIHDYYWNQASYSEDDAEEILLPGGGGQSDSFDDIL
mmetsp:Transcript_9744/g.22912  ORF Transcript_9744/g.22912 Transcript_9744/m.22912 type:complete len:1159 (+) Transcript_9744:50-3526(+)